MASEEQTTNCELKDMISKLLKTQEEVLTKLDTVSSEVKHLTYRVSQMEKSVESLHNSHSSDQATNVTYYQEMERVRGSISTALAFTNPFIVVFYGLENQRGVSLDTMFRNLLIEQLHIDKSRANSMPFHAQYLPKMSQEDAHFPICVTFRVFKDRIYVCDKVNKYHRQLKSMNITAEGLYERLPAIWKS